jgi:hypothetical protein
MKSLTLPGLGTSQVVRYTSKYQVR